MLVVGRDSVPDAGAPLPQLQLVERPPGRALERGGKGNGLDRGHMPTRADFRAIFN